MGRRRRARRRWGRRRRRRRHGVAEKNLRARLRIAVVHPQAARTDEVRMKVGDLEVEHRHVRVERGDGRDGERRALGVEQHVALGLERARFDPAAALDVHAMIRRQLEHVDVVAAGFGDRQLHQRPRRADERLDDRLPVGGVALLIARPHARACGQRLDRPQSGVGQDERAGDEAALAADAGRARRRTGAARRRRRRVVGSERAVVAADVVGVAAVAEQGREHAVGLGDFAAVLAAELLEAADADDRRDGDEDDDGDVLDGRRAARRAASSRQGGTHDSS